MMSGARFEEAIGCFDRSLEEEPEDVRSWNNKGISHLSLGSFEEALQCLEKAIDLDPRNASYW